MFSPGKRNANCDKMKVAANTMMIIILQHINAPNQDTAHLILYNVMCPLYLKKARGQKYLLPMIHLINTCIRYVISELTTFEIIWLTLSSYKEAK